MKLLKTQMDTIMEFRNKFSTIPHEVQMLINEAHKIMKVLGIASMEEFKQENEEKIIEEKS